MSQGLKEAGFHGRTDSVDSDTSSCSTLHANFPDSIVHQYTVKDFLIGCKHNPYSSRYPRIGTITLLHGSTPCQGVSKANRTGGANDDANNEEMYQFMDVVEHFQPPYVTFENVGGATDKNNRHYIQRMIARFLVMGYQVRLFSLNAVEYGDAQFRVRIFIIAAKEGLELPNVPTPTHGKQRHLLPIKTAGDVLGFLEDINPLEYEGIIRAILPNSGVAVELDGHTLKTAKFNDSDIRLTKDNPARTVLKARIVRHYMNMNRPLTRLEQSQLQSFPPTYKFKGTDDEIRDQIGNAVPVNLARAIGKSVMDAIRLITGTGTGGGS
jgi:DNA (cytosine-5)-methyltransferase 1